MALMPHSMDGSGSGSSRGSRNNNNNNNISLGVNKQSTKITKSVKRTSGAAPQHQAPPQPSKQAPPPPVYNINKNDFRNLVQQLTGSPLPERYDQQQQQPPPHPPPRAAAAAAPPPNPKPPNSRLHRIRPPPLNALNSSATGPPSLLRSPAFGNTVSPFFSVPPLPPLTPGDAVWAGNMAVDSPVTRYMKYLQDSMTPGGGGGGGGGPSRNPSPRGFGPPPGGFYSQRPMQYPMGPPLPSPHRPPPPPSPTSQFLLPSPLPSPGSFFTLPSPGSPFPMNFFAQSPSGQFGFPGGGPLLSPLPPSPGVMFSLHSPTGRFASRSPGWREPPRLDLPREDFSFPDPDRDRRL